jgi:hypothetical protein
MTNKTKIELTVGILVVIALSFMIYFNLPKSAAQEKLEQQERMHKAQKEDKESNIKLLRALRSIH